MLVAYQDWRSKKAGQAAAERLAPARGKSNDNKAKVKVKA
jgi:hypothetical protein